MTSNKLNTLIKSGNLSFIERKIIFIGVVSATIFDKSIFKANDDLHPYISCFEKEFNIINIKTKEPGFADYVYRSRPLLFSRIAKYLFNLDDFEKFNKLINQHFNYHNESQKNVNKVKKQKKESSILADMELKNGK